MSTRRYATGEKQRVSQQGNYETVYDEAQPSAVPSTETGNVAVKAMLPWRVDGPIRGGDQGMEERWEILDNAGDEIFTVYNAEIAALIVKAVNIYDQLVAQMANMREELIQIRDLASHASQDNAGDVLTAIYNRARAAAVEGTKIDHP